MADVSRKEEVGVELRNAYALFWHLHQLPPSQRSVTQQHGHIQRHDSHHHTVEFSSRECHHHKKKNLRSLLCVSRLFRKDSGPLFPLPPLYKHLQNGIRARFEKRTLISCILENPHLRHQQQSREEVEIVKIMWISFSHVLLLSLKQHGRETLMSRQALIRLKRTNLLSF